METGRIVREGPVAELADDPTVRDAYLGTAGSAAESRKSHVPQKVW
ncbi:MAG: ABC transporter ATP-binding protein C-terminal domain-containing protein [Methylovirgula sp.]